MRRKLAVLLAGLACLTFAAIGASPVHAAGASLNASVVICNPDVSVCDSLADWRPGKVYVIDFTPDGWPVDWATSMWSTRVPMIAGYRCVSCGDAYDCNNGSNCIGVQTTGVWGANNHRVIWDYQVADGSVWRATVWLNTYYAWDQDMRNSAACAAVGHIFANYERNSGTDSCLDRIDHGTSDYPNAADIRYGNQVWGF